ncbi:transposase, partial [Pseudomonas lundensis]|nr:transposase [Pseudomonas lundensis]
MSKYSEQFKLEAITSYLAGGTSYRVAADKHEIEFGMLRRWVAS